LTIELPPSIFPSSINHDRRLVVAHIWPTRLILSCNSRLTWLCNYRDHPASEVYVTGTFDDWSKSEKLDRVGDGFSKNVTLSSADEKIYYKVSPVAFPSGAARSCSGIMDHAIQVAICGALGLYAIISCNLRWKNHGASASTTE